MPAKGWRKKDHPGSYPTNKEKRIPGTERIDPEDEVVHVAMQPDKLFGGRPPPKPPAKPKESEPEPSDEEEEFVTSKDVEKTKVSGGTAPRVAASVLRGGGFIAEMITASGQKLHDVEYALTKHPIFLHSDADERIWKALGRAIEEEADLKMKKLWVCLAVTMASEGSKVAICVKDIAEAKKRASNAPGGHKRKENEGR